MGALAALTKWIPEDDLLLKNAVEAGASLESLAKGAVHFSRRYTITELQDRWRSLLYDLDTSAEASARIIEIEIELSVSNAPKANRLTSSKGKEIHGKRKGGSVRSHYYAMLKRVCSEPCNSANLGLLEPSSLISTGNGVGCRHFKPQIGNAVSNCVTAINSEFQEPSPNHYDHLGIAYDTAQDILHDIAMLGSAAVDASLDTADRFHTNSIDDDFPDGIADNDCLFQYTESNVPLVDKLEADNAHQVFHHDFVPSDMPQPAVERLSSSDLYQNLHETGLPQTLPETNIYGHDGVKTESLPDFDRSVAGHDEQVCSGFESKDDLSSQVLEHGDSFNRLRCSSSQAGITVWETIDGISPPTIGIDGHFEDNQGANSLLDFHDITEMHSPGCHAAISEAELQDRTPDGALDSSRIVVENEYMGASSSYMNFADDDFLLINMDDDIADRSSLNGLNSILLSSPSDAQQDNACISSGPDVEAADTCPIVNDAACQGDSNDLLVEIYPANADDGNVCIAGVNEPSTSVRISHNTESTEGLMFCSFNTEDTEIPCNDDVYLPCHSLPSSPSDVEQSPMEKHVSISSSGEFLLDDGRPIAQPFASSVKTGFSNIGLMESSDGCRTETKSIENESRAAASRCAGVALGEPNSCTSINACLYPSSQSTQKQENTAKTLGKHGTLDLFLTKPAQVSDLAICNANHYKEEANMHETLQGCIQYQEQSRAEMPTGDMEKSMAKSDQGDHFSDSDCDVPNFSDIEAMILDMDLDPQDQDSSLFTKEVSRYQCGHTKKDIIRLEQGAYSYLQRAISSHKAFAVLYGRHLKHYIKSPKVSLGRATEDMKVDIDLSREGRSKKISRRQAIIKMEKDGSFFLTNVGKGSIFINSKEVPAEKRTKLTSGCLIEIRGMRFIFEVNQDSVKQYLNNLQCKQEEDSKFDWTHDQNHQIS